MLIAILIASLVLNAVLIALIAWALWSIISDFVP
jgi:hypothetical protein